MSEFIKRITAAVTAMTVTLCGSVTAYSEGEVMQITNFQPFIRQ